MLYCSRGLLAHPVSVAAAGGCMNWNAMPRTTAINVGPLTPMREVQVEDGVQMGTALDVTVTGGGG